MYLVDILVLIWVLNSTIIFLVGCNIHIYLFYYNFFNSRYLKITLIPLKMPHIYY
jgi:hypothetical protein